MNRNEDQPVTLSPADAEALDALIESRVGGPRLVGSETPEASPQASQRVGRLMAMIDLDPAADPPADLARRTMQRVIMSRSVDLDVSRTYSFRAPAIPIRLGEILAVAAMLLLGVCIALPVLARTRSDAMRIACEANLGAAGRGFQRYAMDFVGAMPRGFVRPGDEWFHVGQTASADAPVRSNSANLYRLARAHFIDPAALACPENENAPKHLSADMLDWPTPESVSYSYQNQFTERPTRLWRSPRMAVLADRNPKFVYRNGKELLYLKVMPDSAASIVHQDRGQNILFADGSVFWLVHPVIAGGDNIWVAEGVNDYNGTESPSRHDDSFLVP